MSFIGCTYNYAQCTQASADYFIRYSGGDPWNDMAPVCSECLQDALALLKRTGMRLASVEPI